MKIKKYNDFINEEDGSGAAFTSGMGDVVAAQPSSIPGSTLAPDATIGSGDVGFGSTYMYTKYSPTDPFKIAKKMGSSKKNRGVSKSFYDIEKNSKKKANKHIKSLEDILNKDITTKVTKIKDI